MTSMLYKLNVLSGCYISTSPGFENRPYQNRGDFRFSGYSISHFDRLFPLAILKTNRFVLEPGYYQGVLLSGRKNAMLGGQKPIEGLHSGL